MRNVQILKNCADILIIDDSSSDMQVLTEMLREAGYSVRNTLYSKVALQLVQEKQPDIILFNIKYVHLDEHKVYETLKLGEKFKKVPIIFICKFNKDINRDEIFEAGGADYIIKPFSQKEVLTRIEMHLKLCFGQTEFENYNISSQNLLQEQVDTLKKENINLEDKVSELTCQLKDITSELKEFNITLEEEINERVKTEEKLRESEMQLSAAIEKAPVPIILFAEDGEIIKISKAWTDITGYAIEDLPTVSEWDKAVCASNEGVQKIGLSNLTNFEKSKNDGEYSIITKDGELRTWNFYSAYIGILKDGRKLFSRIAVDLTVKKYMENLKKVMEEETRRLNELKEYDRIKTEFFANISHEFRTPISVIFSTLQMHELKLKKCECLTQSKGCLRYMKIIKQNGYRLLKLINNLIDITKIDSGYIELIETNYDIVSIIKNVTLSVADYIENKGLSLTFNTNIEEKTIACSPEKIERIILNLLSNAVKFTPTGGSITVDIEDGTENICIRIKDTGRGIPQEKIDSIFERFIQVDKSMTRDHEGSGIGLSLVKALVELHGGTIAVKSRQGCGTEFILNFPCKLVEESNEQTGCSNAVSSNTIDKINIELSDIYNI